MILSNRTRRTFFVLSSIFFAISLIGCAGLGGGRGPGAGLVDGGAGGLANLGANDVAAWDLWFETNGLRNSQPTAGEPGNLVLDVINSFSNPVTLHIQWIEDNALRFEDNYPNIPVGESTVSAGYAFSTEGDHTIMAKIRLVDPAVAEEAANNQATAVINVQAAGANLQGGGGGGQPVQGVDLTWTQVMMTDVAGTNEVREPVAGVPVNIIASSANNGNTAALNITRSFSFDGLGGSDSLAQCVPGQCAPYIIHGYTFFRAGPNTFTLAMAGFAPPQAANARGTISLPVTVNVLPAGANPPPTGGGSGQPVQGVDLTWSEVVMTDAAGTNEVREPVVGVPVKIVATSTNHGDTAAQNISRFLSVDGNGFHNDSGMQINPGQTVPFVAPDTCTFATIGDHTLSLSMTSFTPPQAANARGSLSTIIHVNVLPAGGGGSGLPILRPLHLPRLVGTVTTVPPTLAMTSTGEPDCELVAEGVSLWAAGQDHEVGHVTVGQRGWVSYTVKNKKGAAVNDVNSEVQFLLNGQVVETIPAKLNVPANGQATGKSDFTPFTTPGVYKMALVVDPLNQKKDDRRSNNILTRSIRVEAARGPVVATSPGTDAGRTVVMAPECELVAEGVEFWVHGVDHPVTRVMVGQRGWVRYTVKNKKGKAVDNVSSEVRFLLNGQVMQVVPADLHIPSQGQKTGKNDVAPFTTPGMYKMALMVDPLNAKKDNHRGDNVLTRSLQVDAYRQYNPSNDSKPSGTLTDVFPGLLDTFTGGKKPKNPTGYTPPPSTPTEQTPPPAQPPTAKSPKKFTTSYQS